MTYEHTGTETQASVDSFTYTISDAAGQVSAETTVTVTVAAVVVIDNAPVTMADSAQVDNLGVVVIDVIDNDTDEDEIDGGTIAIVSEPTSGIATVADGQVTYVHTGTETEETVDTFTYTVSDAAGQVSDAATVTITIDAAPIVDEAPIAVADIATVANQGTVDIDVIANDTDEAEIDGATITIVTEPTSGTATVADGQVTYEHTGQETEESVDTFTYTISDAAGQVSDVATVTVTIEAAPVVDEAPIAVADAATVSNLGTVDVDVIENDTDEDPVDGDTITIVTEPGSGAATVVDGLVTYEHTGSETEAFDDTFTYTISDAAGQVSDEATVTVTVAAPEVIDLAPVAMDDDDAQVAHSGTVDIDVIANDNDEEEIDGGTITIVDQPESGTATVVDGQVTYEHTGSETEAFDDSFTYTISDAAGQVSNIATVTVAVAAESADNELAKSNDQTELSADTITDLILVTGQSNVRGSQTEYDPALDITHNRILAFTSAGIWETADLHQAWDVDGWHPGNGSLNPYCLADPNCEARTPYNNFAFHFAKTIVEADPDRVVGLIIASAPGEGIAHWDVGSEFSQIVDSKVLDALNTQGVKAQIDGILWHQGETDWLVLGTSDPDASDTEKAYADYYPDKLSALISNFRTQSWFGINRPFICGETRQAPVNEHLMALNDDGDLHTACVAGSDLTTLEMDLFASPPILGTHFDAEALRVLGQRYAQQYLQMTQ